MVEWPKRVWEQGVDSKYTSREVTKKDKERRFLVDMQLGAVRLRNVDRRG